MMPDKLEPFSVECDRGEMAIVALYSNACPFKGPGNDRLAKISVGEEDEFRLPLRRGSLPQTPAPLGRSLR